MCIESLIEDLRYAVDALRRDIAAHPLLVAHLPSAARPPLAAENRVSSSVPAAGCCPVSRLGRRPGELGQASLEYLLVGLVLIAVIAALSGIWSYVAGGGLAELVSSSVSHAADSAGGVADVLLY